MIGCGSDKNEKKLNNRENGSRIDVVLIILLEITMASDFNKINGLIST